MSPAGWALIVVAVTVAAAGGWAIGSVAARRRASAATDRRVADLEAEAETTALAGQRQRVEQARLERALEAVPEGMVICDEDGTIVFKNQPAEEFFTGRPAALIIETAIGELITEAVAGRADQRSLDLFGPPRRRLVLSALPLGDDDQPAGALIVAEDTSERHRLDAVRRDFVANISHELKTPVGALGLLAETLLDEDDPAVNRRLAERMSHEADRVGRTIDDLLALSQLEAQERPRREPVRLDVVMAEAGDRVAPAADLAGISVDVHDPPADLAVLGDRRQLTSALYNLLENGVKYSDKGSTVDLSAAARPDGWVEIVVADQGDGIPEPDRERIFERFFRVDRARSRDTGGTGLGLAIVRHVVANHDGEITVESHEGEGSTFTLRLPAAPGTGGPQ